MTRSQKSASFIFISQQLPVNFPATSLTIQNISNINNSHLLFLKAIYIFEGVSETCIKVAAPQVNTNGTWGASNHLQGTRLYQRETRETSPLLWNESTSPNDHVHIFPGTHSNLSFSPLFIQPILQTLVGALHNLSIAFHHLLHGVLRSCDLLLQHSVSPRHELAGATNR